MKKLFWLFIAVVGLLSSCIVEKENGDMACKSLVDSQECDDVELMEPRLIPWSPLLNAIPLTAGQDSEMTFLFYGLLPEGTAVQDFDLCYSVNDGETVAVELKNDLNTIALREPGKAGDFDLNVSIRERQTGQIIYERKHGATLVEMPAVSAEGHRRLNNLVVEILNQTLKKKNDPQEFDFCTVRNGWIYIAAENAAAENLEIVLDGKLTVIKSGNERLENCRDIAMGSHTLTVKGAANGGRLIVRSIPEIFNYCPGVNSLVNTNPPYDWEFQKKYVLPNVTTLNGGDIAEEDLPELFAAGYKWIASTNTVAISAEDLNERLHTCSGMTSPSYQGVTCDEQFFNVISTIRPYTLGLKRFVPYNDHVIYTWVTDEPKLKGVHHDFMAECLNSSHGNGRLITEVYCHTCPTLEAAKRYLDKVIVKRAACYRNFYPGVINKWGIILGDFNQIPILSLSHHPNVDYKYYLDLQFNYIANHPECRDMGIAGYWGSYYADYELHRWAFMLTRHYCIEGKTTMLSDEYGFTYDPKLIRNGDFARKFDNWTVQGNVTQGEHADYGSRGQNRWGGNANAGDTFAVLTKTGSETSSVSQVVSGLVPGRTYCLQFFTADYNDVQNDKIAPRQFAIRAVLGEGAEIDEQQSWVFVDERIEGRYEHNNGVARGNLHHIVFKAVKPEITVSFDNALAAEGEVLCLNYVMLNPYLDEK